MAIALQTARQNKAQITFFKSLDTEEGRKRERKRQVEKEKEEAKKKKGIEEKKTLTSDSDFL